jgi:hypothetical protein
VSVSSVLAAILCSSDSAIWGRVRTWSFMESNQRSRYLTGKQHATPLASHIEFGPRCTISWRTRSQWIEYGTGSRFIATYVRTLSSRLASSEAHGRPTQHRMNSRCSMAIDGPWCSSSTACSSLWCVSKHWSSVSKNRPTGMVIFQTDLGSGMMQSPSSGEHRKGKHIVVS